jgi:hypothetical protein
MAVTLCKADERGALSITPWEMDDAHDLVLDNRFVRTRYTHECAICLEDIAVGERVRAQREAYDGQAKTFYFCLHCCRAMAALADGRDRDGSRLGWRYDTGRENARQREIGARTVFQELP